MRPKPKDVVNKIVHLLKAHEGIDDDKATHMAERIYADVLAPLIDDERSYWMALYTLREDEWDC